ncbi:FAST kinase domain-containing protein 4 isoform X2 [Elgaria multicarinata webbii]|uniref:FAST kinase domain-containing protein 4 isoform X2 n=1 Tax=Elgaria multicarinata webbii TaxID=159646 RepID=UPI002FCD291C
MAAKLVLRWYRLYRVSSPLCVQATVASPGGKMLNTRVPSLAPLASLTTCRLLRQADKLSVKEQAQWTPPDRSEVDDLINTCSTPEDLLHLAEVYPLNGNQAALIVVRLSRMAVVEKKLDPGGVLEDKRFQHLLHSIHKQVTQVWNTSLVNLLKSLYSLGLERGRRELLSVEQEVRWRMRRLAFKHLASMAKHVATYTPWGEPSELLSDLVKHLELRWTEIEDPVTVVALMTKVGALSPALMEHLEDKALELAEKFSIEDMRKVAMALAFQNRRSIPLLRAISYHFVQKHFAVNRSILLDLAFAFGKLNFHQTQMFQKIASDLHPHVPELSPSEVVSCVKSFTYLKWLNLPLFEAFAQYTIDNGDRFTPVHLSNLILAFARLNFQPGNGEVFYTMIHRRLDGHLSDLEPHLLVDLVWSLCALQQVKAAHLQRVLVPKFHAGFLADQSPKGKNYQLKLIHINTTARLECADYMGPFLPLEVLGIQELEGAKKATPLQSGLQEVLKGVAGDEAKVRFAVDTDWGWQLDAEMVLNGDNQPLPIAGFAAPPPARAQSSRLTFLCFRLAFLRWEFPNFSNRSKDLLGRFAMARRHIQAAGFLIVDVPYYEWFDLKSERQKAAYLKDKMNKAVAEAMAK